MEHESFENPEIAKILNDHFVSIKVDREERPDLDQIYMTAVQLLTGQGGWPMSVFLTPDLQPFSGGTYFPPDDRYGRPGFKRVLLTIVEWWQTRRAETRPAPPNSSPRPSATPAVCVRRKAASIDTLLSQASATLERAFDPTYGGFGSAPKFPHPMDLRLLLRIWQRFGDDNALHMVRHTLDRMAMGGIYDHLGGGFPRYSTDARWLVPHFEKMLYDNALLVPGYLEAFQVDRRPFYREVVEETLAWVTREMTSPRGAVLQHAGRRQRRRRGQVLRLDGGGDRERAGCEDATLFNSVYGVEPGGNWHDPHGHAPPSANILHRIKTFDQCAELHRLPRAGVAARLARCRSKLFDVRSRRVRPGLDDKALTSWNGLMIGAFALAAQVLDNPAYAETAGRAADFILTRMRTPDGRLLRTYSSGAEPKLNAYLEDYAFLWTAWSRCTRRPSRLRWITAALDLARVMIDQFWDDAEGGFFYTGRDHEALIARNKDAARQRDPLRQRDGGDGAAAAGETDGPQRSPRQGRADAAALSGIDGGAPDGGGADADGAGFPPGADAGDRDRR